MGQKVVVPDNPTPAQLMHLLAVCSNEIATLADKVMSYRQDAALKQTALKRAMARAKVKYSGSGTVDIVRAKVELDPAVVLAQDEYDIADCVYQIAKGEFDGYDAQFTALRKQAEIRKTEMSRING